LPNESIEEVCLCPLEGVIDVIARKWSLFVINAVGNDGTARFSKIVERLPGISPNDSERNPGEARGHEAPEKRVLCGDSA